MPKTPGFPEAPPMLLPAGYIDMDRAVEIAQRPEDDPRARIRHCSPSEHRLWQLLASGRVTSVAQFWNDGTTMPLAAEQWTAPYVNKHFDDNGAVSIQPEGGVPIGDWASIRIHEAQLLTAIDLDQAATSSEPKAKGESAAAPAAIDEAPERPATSAPHRTFSAAEIEAAYVERSKTLGYSSENEDLAFLRSLNPAINRPRARELRRELAPSHWKRSGPKRRE